MERINIHQVANATFVDGLQKVVYSNATPSIIGIDLFQALRDNCGLVDGIAAGIKLSANLHEDTVVESVFNLDVVLNDGQYDITMTTENNGLKSDSNLKTRSTAGLFDYIQTNLIIWVSAHLDESDKVLAALNARLVTEHEKSLLANKG